jgi:hypothetical protein
MNIDIPRKSHWTDYIYMYVCVFVCHIWPRVCTVCHSHKPEVLCLLMTFHRISLIAVICFDTHWTPGSVIFFYWVLVMFQQCGIFLLGFGNVPAVWYFFYWVLVMFRQCGIFLLGFGNVPAVCITKIVTTFSYKNEVKSKKIPHCRNITKTQ